MINVFLNLNIIKNICVIIDYVNKTKIGDWGLGIGPNPQSPYLYFIIF